MVSTVLVVDDDPSVLMTVKRILERSDFVVQTAESGKECLNALEKGFKGLILMDVIMPQMDGWDTIQEMVNRDLIEGVIIVMLTGEVQPCIKMDNLKEYILDYVRKPFDYDKLISVVKEYISYLD